MPRRLCNRTGHQPKVSVRPRLHPGALRRPVLCRRALLPPLRWLRRLSVSGLRPRVHYVQGQPPPLQRRVLGNLPGRHEQRRRRPLPSVLRARGNLNLNLALLSFRSSSLVCMASPSPVVFTLVFFWFRRRVPLAGQRFAVQDAVHHREVGMIRSDSRRAQGQVVPTWPLRLRWLAPEVCNSRERTDRDFL